VRLKAFLAILDKGMTAPGRIPPTNSPSAQACGSSKVVFVHRYPGEVIEREHEPKPNQDDAGAPGPEAEPVMVGAIRRRVCSAWGSLSFTTS
jgi:hypothetical protein